MSVNVVAKIPMLKRLSCAYTGVPAEVRVVSHRGAEPLYFSPTAFDPSEFQDSAEALFQKLSMRDGVQGAAAGGAELVCPYTGARMTVEDVPGFGVRAKGGFSPSQPVASPALFARLMMTRGGVVPEGAPEYVPVRVAARDLVDGPEERPDPSPVTEAAAREMAERLLHGRDGKVTVPVQGRKGAGRGKV